MAYGLGVDLGTTYTAAAVRVGDRVEVVQLGGQRPEIPSLVFVKPDGEMVIGESAERRGDEEPDRLVREFKRRIGDPVPIMVAGSPYSAHMLTARVLRHVVDAVTRLQGEPPGAITVAHPANWTRFKRDYLGQAIHLAELDGVALRTEPEMAALQYAASERVHSGETLAVYDLGGGTFDAAVLRKTGTGFSLLGRPEGIENLGGGDLDEAVLDHVAKTLGPAFAELDPDDDVAVGLARLRRDCVRAKENLSFDTETTVQVALPGLHRPVRLNRSEFEARVGPPLEQTVAAMRRALRSAGVDATDLRCILLAGGSSRIPLVGQMLSAAFDRPLAFDPHPEHSVALGAALTTGPTPTPQAAPLLEPIRAPLPVPAPSSAPPAVAAVAPAVAAAGAPTAVIGAPVPSTSTAAKGTARVEPRPPTTGEAAPTEVIGAPAHPGRGSRALAALSTRRGRSVVGIAAAAIVAVIAAAVWLPALGKENPSPSTSSPAAPPGPEELWRAPAGGPVLAAAAVDAERVYFVSGRTIQAVRRVDGKPAWPKPYTAGADIVSAPQVVGDTLYASGRDRVVHAVDTAAGTKRWTLTTGPRIPGPPTVTADAVYFGTEGGSVYRFRLPDRSQDWRYQTGNAVAHRPAVTAGLVVASSGDGNLYGFGVDDPDPPRFRIGVDPSSEPVIAGDRVLVGSKDKKLYAIDPTTREPDWTFPTGAAVVSTPVVSGALVYLGGDDGVLYAIELATGIERWRFPGAKGERFGTPVVAGNVLYVATQTGRVYAVDAATPRKIWEHGLGSAAGPVRVVDGVLYVGTADKVVHALRVAEPGAPAPAATSDPAAATSTPAQQPPPRDDPQPNDPDDDTDDEPSGEPSTTPPGLLCVKGRTTESARSALQDAGFSVLVEERPMSTQSLTGRVLDQRPDCGAQVEQGITVTIVVGVFDLPPQPSIIIGAPPAGG